MRFAYEGPATLRISARFFGAEPLETLNEEIPIQLGGSGQPGIAELHFEGDISAPKNANFVSVELPSGLIVGGALVQGHAGAVGGWLRFEVSETDLGLINELNQWT